MKKHLNLYYIFLEDQKQNAVPPDQVALCWHQVLAHLNSREETS